MSSWLDLINVGLNAAHSHQIRKAQEQLQQMEADAVEAALRQQVLEIMRNFVFEIAQDIKALEEHLETAPQQVYIVAHALRWRLQDMGITPDLFPEFRDKEYVQQTQTKIRYAIQESKTMLTADQRKEADKAVKFIEDSNLLQDAIEATSAKEDLEATEPEWERLSKKAKGTKSKKTFGCLGLLATFSIVPVILVGIVTIMSDASRFLGNISGIVAMLVWTAALAGSIALLAQSKPNRYEKLQETREAWRSKLLPREKWEKVVSRWGEKTSQGYRDIQESHNDYVRGIFGQVEGFDKFLPVGD
jgi:lipopolysaccharide biosynthesis glycosyltransferase